MTGCMPEIKKDAIFIDIDGNICDRAGQILEKAEDVTFDIQGEVMTGTEMAKKFKGLTYDEMKQMLEN